MTTDERIANIRAKFDDLADSVQSRDVEFLLAELDAAKQLNADWEAASLVGGPRIDALRAELDAARAKDAEAHAVQLAAKDAEIASLRAQVQQWRDHIDRSAEIENVADLYRHDPLAMADAIVRLREDVSALRAEKD